MARWQPGARARLAAAAFELFLEQGYEQTTVPAIAARAGLDKRTFYRQFGDKREVLFSGGQQLEELIVGSVADHPAAVDQPLTAVVAALERAAREMFTGRVEFARERQKIIEGSPELMERELLKMTSLARAVAGTLRGKGVSPTAAHLAAESGVTILQIAFARWIAPDNDAALPDLIVETARELRTVTEHL